MEDNYFYTFSNNQAEESDASDNNNAFHRFSPRLALVTGRGSTNKLARSFHLQLNT